jgi:Rrf2 family transcriptional regulator, nitric oxide-sensitive transcriptional repressor
MRLTRYTDYAMRVLLYLASQPDARLSSIGEIARRYGISQNHLMKVVNGLVRAGFIEGVRGRSGGIRLARDAGTITVGAVVRHTEDDFKLVDCSDCVIAPACGLICVLQQATDAFLAVLDSHSLADLQTGRGDLLSLFAVPEMPESVG